jgi:hypothetical protein
MARGHRRRLAAAARRGERDPIVDPGHPDYRIVPYLDRMDLALALADLVVSRSGAATVSEVSALGIPAVYVPYAVGNGEQALNARGAVAAGAAQLIEDAAFSPDRVREQIVPLLRDDAALSAMRAAAQARTAAVPRAASSVIAMLDRRSRAERVWRGRRASSVLFGRCACRDERGRMRMRSGGRAAQRGVNERERLLGIDAACGPGRRSWRRCFLGGRHPCGRRPRRARPAALAARGADVPSGKRRSSARRTVDTWCRRERAGEPGAAASRRTADAGSMTIMRCSSRSWMPSGWSRRERLRPAWGRGT